MWSHEVRHFFFNRRWKLNTYSSRAAFSWQDFLAVSIALRLFLPEGVMTPRQKKKKKVYGKRYDRKEFG